MVTQHINASSHVDNDGNHLIKDSTLPGYRNPPEPNFQVLPSYSKPVVGLVGYPPITSDFKLAGQIGVPPITSSSTSITPSSNKDHKFDKAYSEVSGTAAFGQGQYANIPPESDHNIQPPNIATSLSNAPTAGGSVPSTSSHPQYERQKSTPTDALLSGEMTASVTSTAKSNQLLISDHSPVIASVPCTDQPFPEASQASPTADSKFGKTNLKYLKDRLQQKKEETMAKIGAVGSHPQSCIDYVNAAILFQAGVSDNTNKRKSVVLNYPLDKKPIAVPRSTTSNTHSSSSISSSTTT